MYTCIGPQYVNNNMAYIGYSSWVYTLYTVKIIILNLHNIYQWAGRKFSNLTVYLNLHQQM